MTEFAAIPNRVFAMGKDDVGHAVDLCTQREIVFHEHVLSNDRESLYEISRMDQPQFFRLLPVDSVSKPFLRQRLRKLREVELPRHLLALGMAAITARRIFFLRHLRTSGKDGM